mgnify:CR=1 FL=1
MNIINETKNKLLKRKEIVISIDRTNNPGFEDALNVLADNFKILNAHFKNILLLWMLANSPRNFKRALLSDLVKIIKNILAAVCRKKYAGNNARAIAQLKKLHFT